MDEELSHDAQDPNQTKQRAKANTIPADMTDFELDPGSKARLIFQSHSV